MARISMDIKIWVSLFSFLLWVSRFLSRLHWLLATDFFLYDTQLQGFGTTRMCVCGRWTILSFPFLLAFTRRSW
ncbi:hypothetical protein DM02DRAFT_273140 [Periconia macrospinosa]|uniref:Uncharacterized protein n=1 Tax=Periconia macrospinosa TaxID=97972 RepID=A0A2V1DZS7_9PLEO|nr:hypothetical protein DM02DRAFT_273140 [Periconia macrospinosa]